MHECVVHLDKDVTAESMICERGTFPIREYECADKFGGAALRVSRGASKGDKKRD